MARVPCKACNVVLLPEPRILIIQLINNHGFWELPMLAEMFPVTSLKEKLPHPQDFESEPRNHVKNRNGICKK